MKLKMGIATIATVVVAVVVAILVPHIVAAQDSQDTPDNSTNVSTDTSEANKQAAEQAQHQAEQLAEQRKHAAEQRQEALQQAAEQAKEAAQKDSEQAKQTAEKAKEAFQKTCESKREGFKTRLEAIDTNAQSVGERLATIDSRIEAYVKDHNLSVANYAALLAAVKTQQQLLAQVAPAAKTQAEGFDCGDSKEAAKASTLAFRDVLQQEITIIQADKTALKNLIAAVKAAAQQQGATNGSTH